MQLAQRFLHLRRRLPGPGRLHTAVAKRAAVPHTQYPPSPMQLSQSPKTAPIAPKIAAFDDHAGGARDGRHGTGNKRSAEFSPQGVKAVLKQPAVPADSAATAEDAK
eukprot:5922202-Prymnesium_polylepis.1